MKNHRRTQVRVGEETGGGEGREGRERRDEQNNACAR